MALARPTAQTNPPRCRQLSSHIHKCPLSPSGGARSQRSINERPSIMSGWGRRNRRYGTAAASFSAVGASSGALLSTQPMRIIPESIRPFKRLECKFYWCGSVIFTLISCWKTLVTWFAHVDAVIGWILTPNHRRKHTMWYNKRAEQQNNCTMHDERVWSNLIFGDWREAELANYTTMDLEYYRTMYATINLV